MLVGYPMSRTWLLDWAPTVRPVFFLTSIGSSSTRFLAPFHFETVRFPDTDRTVRAPNNQPQRIAMGCERRAKRCIRADAVHASWIRGRDPQDGAPVRDFPWRAWPGGDPRPLAPEVAAGQLLGGSAWRDISEEPTDVHVRLLEGCSERRDSLPIAPESHHRADQSPVPENRE
jgi:hypothetical protein